MTDPMIASNMRAVRIAEVRRASGRVRRLERDLERAIAERDAKMIEYHGDQRDGGLSYEDLAAATGTRGEDGISRGRVIQIVQGKSEYSKRQTKRRAS